MKSQDSQLVLYSVFAMLIVLLVLVGYFSIVPANSEYWGIDPDVNSKDAALAAFDKGDYRFLAIRYKATQNDILDHVPGVNGCGNHPDGTDEPAHVTEVLSQFDPALLKRLRNYSRAYNVWLAKQLNEHHDAECQVLYTF